MEAGDLGNEYFRKAERKATGIARNKDRLKNLVREVTEKIAAELQDKLGSVGLSEKLNTLVRMIKAYIRGEYKIIPWKVLVSVAAALIYFITPLDLIPDFIPVTGFIDDFTVIIWVFKSFQSEIDAFLLWENEGINTSSGQ